MRNRRDFLKVAGMGVAATAITGMVSPSQAKTQSGRSKFGFQLGVASYTLRKFSTEEALDMTLRCGINRITFKDMHLPLDADQDTIRRTVELCRRKGVALYGAGVINMRSIQDVDRAFEYAKAAGMDMIVGVPNHEFLEYVEGKVKQYDIKLAIHNHGPGDKRYPSAESGYKLIQNMDKRMGLCLDIGHTKRINGDPIKDLKDFYDRVHDIHIKDVTAASREGTTSIVGRGVIDIPAFMRAVVNMGYKGTLALEYEAEADDPLPGMMESVGYIKGIMAML